LHKGDSQVEKASKSNFKKGKFKRRRVELARVEGRSRRRSSSGQHVPHVVPRCRGRPVVLEDVLRGERGEHLHQGCAGVCQGGERGENRGPHRAHVDGPQQAEAEQGEKEHTKTHQPVSVVPCSRAPQNPHGAVMSCAITPKSCANRRATPLESEFFNPRASACCTPPYPSLRPLARFQLSRDASSHQPPPTRTRTTMIIHLMVPKP